jgi:hypothetical protein
LIFPVEDAEQKRQLFQDPAQYVFFSTSNESDRRNLSDAADAQKSVERGGRADPGPSPGGKRKGKASKRKMTATGEKITCPGGQTKRPAKIKKKKM